MSNPTRRNFIKKSSLLCMGGCALAFSTKLSALSFIDDDAIPDPKKLNYCGYSCPADCKFYIATVENDVEKKKVAFETWDLNGRYGLEFDPETAFCYKCKTEDKPEGPVVANCTVRKCTMEKGLDCCIECNELSTCEKDLWKRYPDFHKGVVQMQEKYLAATT